MCTFLNSTLLIAILKVEIKAQIPLDKILQRRHFQDEKWSDLSKMDGPVATQTYPDSSKLWKRRTRQPQLLPKSRQRWPGHERCLVLYYRLSHTMGVLLMSRFEIFNIWYFFPFMAVILNLSMHFYSISSLFFISDHLVSRGLPSKKRRINKIDQLSRFSIVIMCWWLINDPP